jgi:putative membrane protein
MKTNTFVLALMLAIPAFAGADDKGAAPKTTEKAKDEKVKLSEADMKIISHVHHVNMMEIDMGKLAQRQGTADVKKYGEMLVKDHNAADKELTAYAKKRGIAKIPAEKAANDAEEAEMKKQMESMAGLKKLKGADFDREYLRMMVEGHDKELAMTDPNIAIATDSDLKTLLESRRTTLTRHSDAAKELRKKSDASASAAEPSK